VLAWDEDGSSGGERWRLVVLEDAGELARLDAGRSAGMAQLLNLTDGLMGQGARTLVLITTNEPVAALHPGVRRPGRCLAEVEFVALTAAEARRWLHRAGTPAPVTRPHTLSELFALRRRGRGLEPACAQAVPRRSASRGRSAESPSPTTGALSFLKL